MNKFFTATRAFSTTAPETTGIFSHKGVKLIVGGWSLFIAENLILS